MGSPVDASVSDVLFDLAPRLEGSTSLPIDVGHIVADARGCRGGIGEHSVVEGSRGRDRETGRIELKA